MIRTDDIKWLFSEEIEKATEALSEIPEIQAAVEAVLVRLDGTQVTEHKDLIQTMLLGFIYGSMLDHRDSV